MTDPSLAASGDEREILLRALREYSDTCVAPNLTAHCPFSIDTDAGGRFCEEQCLDLLGRNQAPAAVDEIDLGAGFSVFRRRRPRPRTGNDAGARPFDARATWLADEDQPLEQWHTVSLIVGLIERLTRPPPADETSRATRHERIVRSIEILEERGLDFESCLKLPMVGRVVSTMTVLLLFAPRGDHASESTGTSGAGTSQSDLRAFVEAWTPALEDMGIAVGNIPENRESAAQRGRHMAALLPRLATWAATAEFDDIVSWRPPIGCLPEPDQRLVEQISPAGNRWIFDRFHETYLTNWSTSSLHQEWKWTHGEAACPIPESEMKLRHVNESTLAKLIADRAAHRTDVDSSLQLGTFERVARELLQSGSREAAAAVFEAVVIEAPDNAEAHNDLGFCLIQDEPSEALDALERARELGYRPAIVNIANRGLCLIKLERYGPASALIDEGFVLAADSPYQPAWLWAPDHGASVEVVYVDNVAVYMARLGLAAAQASNDERRLRRWTEALDKLQDAE